MLLDDARFIIQFGEDGSEVCPVLRILLVHQSNERFPHRLSQGNGLVSCERVIT
jgi:hypothetical protein